MRAIDDSGPRYAAVLRELLIWKHLPESDLARLVPGYFLITDETKNPFPIRPLEQTTLNA